MVLEKFQVEGQAAIVTGAGRGIGAATATALAEAGADVVIGARTVEQLEEVAATVEGHGRQAAVVPGDLSDRDGLATLVEAAKTEFGRLDIIVNNVGGSMPQPFLDTSEQAFRHALSWNVTTAFNLTQLAVPVMLESGGGSVVNIASSAGMFAMRGFAAYGTAKASLIHLTRELAQDLAPKIRVNAVCPGAVATSALETVLEHDEIKQAMVDGTPLGRLGEPWEIAAAVLYFASPASAYATGQVLAVAGGIEGSNLEMGIPDL